MGRIRSLGNRLRAGGGSSVWTPSQITFTTGLWWDPSDQSTEFQDSARTNPVTASGQFTGGITDKSGKGNHFVQASASARPEWDLISGIYSNYCDGLDDGGSTATFIAGTLGASMDLFITIKRATTGNMVVISQAPSDATKFVGVCQSAAGTSAVGNVGAVWTCFVNGSQVGGAASVTRDQLNTALGSGAYKVMEFRDLDLSTWTQITLSLYSSFMVNGDIAQIVLCPSQSTANRNLLRTYCGAKGGLSL